MKKIILSITFILIALLSVGVRIYELYFMIDESNGFFYKHSETAATIISVALTAVVFGLVIFAFTVTRKLSLQKPPKKSIALGMGSFLMALGLLADSGNFFIGNQDASLLDKIVCICSILSALTFLAWGFKYFTGKGNLSSLALIPLLWSILRLVVSYTHFNGIALVSENVFDILTMCFFMVFWLYHAKILNGISLNHSLNRAFGFGICSAILALLCTLPRFFIEFQLRVDLLSHSPSVEFANLTGALYVIIFLGYFLTIMTPAKAVSTVSKTVDKPIIKPRFVTVNNETETHQDNAVTDTSNSVDDTITDDSESVSDLVDSIIKELEE